MSEGPDGVYCSSRSRDLDCPVYLRACDKCLDADSSVINSTASAGNAWLASWLLGNRWCESAIVLHPLSCTVSVSVKEREPECCRRRKAKLSAVEQFPCTATVKYTESLPRSCEPVADRM